MKTSRLGVLALLPVALILSSCGMSCGGQCGPPWELSVQFVPKTPLVIANDVLQRCGRSPGVTSIGTPIRYGDGVSAFVWTSDLGAQKNKSLFTCLRSSPYVQVAAYPM